MNEDEDYQEFNKRKSTVFDQIKRTAQTQQEIVREDPAEGDTIGKINAKSDSTKLKEFLKNLNLEE